MGTFEWKSLAPPFHDSMNTFATMTRQITRERKAEILQEGSNGR
jgi:hypothetical protein